VDLQNEVQKNVEDWKTTLEKLKTNKLYDDHRREYDYRLPLLQDYILNCTVCNSIVIIVRSVSAL